GEGRFLQVGGEVRVDGDVRQARGAGGFEVHRVPDPERYEPGAPVPAIGEARLPVAHAAGPADLALLVRRALYHHEQPVRLAGTQAAGHVELERNERSLILAQWLAVQVDVGGVVDPLEPQPDDAAGEIGGRRKLLRA